jgi:preprotein translocase subunit YajC
VIIYLLVFVVIAFMLWTTYSQQRRSKKAQEQLQRMVKKGDEVLTVGGMFGTVRKVGDDFVILEVADRTKVRFLRRAIREIVNEEEDVEEDDEAEYVDDEYDEAEYDEQDGDEEDSDEEDSDDEDSGDEADESDEAEEEDDGQELSAETTDDAVDAPGDSVRAPEPPTPPKGS